MKNLHPTLAAKLITVILLCFVCCPISYAADDGGKCYLKKFIRYVGYEGIMSNDPSLVSLNASLGDEARCTYQVQFSSCIGKALARFNSVVELRGTSPKAKTALLMVNITKSLVEHGVEFSYNVEKAGFFASPKFSNIEVSENLFGFPLPGNREILDGKTIKGWRYLCQLGNMSEAGFLKELGADKDFGTEQEAPSSP